MGSKVITKTNRSGIRATVAATLSAAAMLVAAPAVAQEKQLITMSYGSSTDKALNPSTYEKMIKDGYKVTYVPMAGEAGFARLQAEKARPTIDLFHFSSGQQYQAKEMDLLGDVGDLGGANIPDQFKDPDNKWVAFALSPVGILYDKTKMAAPKSWKDLLKPEYKGKVAIPTLTNFVGPPILLQLNEALGGNMDNMDPGFTALRKLVDDGNQLFDRPVSLQTFFGGGDIWMVPYDASNAYRLIELGLPVGFAVPEEGTVANMYVKVIAKGAPNADAAKVAVAEFLKPEAQIAMAKNLHWSPVNADVKLPPELESQVLSGQRLKDSLKPFDQIKMRSLLPAWIDRYNREIASR